jgi:superfamily II helicase
MRQDRETIDRVYTSSILAGSLGRRISGLEESGQIMRTGDIVELTPKGQRTVRRILAVQRLLAIENSG